jgi:hypothetical protein
MITFVYIKNLIKDKDFASITPTSAFGVKHDQQLKDYPDRKERKFCFHPAKKLSR